MGSALYKFLKFLVPNFVKKFFKMPDEQPIKVNKWDGVAVKNAIDDAVRKAIKEKFNYVEKTYLIDLRLTVAAISVSFALFALLWDWLHPFPKSRNVLILCVVCYFILMGILQAYTQWIEGAVFFVAVDDDPTGSRPDRKWTFSSKLKKYDHNYTLEVSMVGGNRQAHAEMTKSVACWLDIDGHLRTDIFFPEIYRLHDSMLPETKDK